MKPTTGPETEKPQPQKMTPVLVSLDDYTDLMNGVIKNLVVVAVDDGKVVKFVAKNPGRTW